MHEARLLAGHLAKPFLRAVRAALLQLPTVLFEFAANRLNLLTRIRVALAIGCDLDYAEVNPKNTARHIGRRWFGLLDSDGEVIRTVTKGFARSHIRSEWCCVGFARSHIRSEWCGVGSFEFGPLLAAVPHHEVFAPLRGGERNAGQVLAFVTTRVENYRRTLAENAADELVFLVRVGDNADGASGECGTNPPRVFLGGQTGLFTNGVVSRVMAVGSTKGSGVPGDARLSENRGDSRQMVGGFVEAFHRVGKCRLCLGCRKNARVCVKAWRGFPRRNFYETLPGRANREDQGDCLQPRHGDNRTPVGGEIAQVSGLADSSDRPDERWIVGSSYAAGFCLRR